MEQALLRAGPPAGLALLDSVLTTLAATLSTPEGAEVTDVTEIATVDPVAS